MQSVWEWRRLKEMGFTFGFWPLSWCWPTFTNSTDEYGGSFRFQVGPFDFAVEVNAGEINNV